MKKLSKAQQEQRADLIRRLNEAKDLVEEACDEHQPKITEVVDAAKAAIERAVAAYNEVLAEAREFAEQAASDMDSYASERSEKWQESDKGSDYASWKDEWEGFSPDDVEPPSIVTPDLEPPDMSHAEDLEALPDEPG